jgi:hypothetical protein
MAAASNPQKAETRDRHKKKIFAPVISAAHLIPKTHPADALNHA